MDAMASELPGLCRSGNRLACQLAQLAAPPTAEEEAEMRAAREAIAAASAREVEERRAWALKKEVEEAAREDAYTASVSSKPLAPAAPPPPPPSAPRPPRAITTRSVRTANIQTQRAPSVAAVVLPPGALSQHEQYEMLRMAAQKKRVASRVVSPAAVVVVVLASALGAFIFLRGI